MNTIKNLFSSKTRSERKAADLAAMAQARCQETEYDWTPSWAK